MYAIPYDPRRHRVTVVPLTHYLERHYPNHDLFVYRHADTENWVVARWIRPGRMMLELLCVGSLQDVDRDMMQRLDIGLRGQKLAAVEFGRQAREADRAYTRHLIDQQQRRRDLKEYVRRRDTIHNRDHPAYA